MSERKYRQSGYQETPKKENRRPEGRSRGADQGYGPRTPQMLGTRSGSRCASCGAALEASVAVSGPCPKCGVALHACTQCASFDPGSRFQCLKPVTEAIKDKAELNECTLFELRTAVERDASTQRVSPTDARSGFDALFKKK